MVYSIGGINSAVINTTTRLNPVRMVVRLSVVFDNLYHQLYTSYILDTSYITRLYYTSILLAFLLACMQVRKRKLGHIRLVEDSREYAKGKGGLPRASCPPDPP